MRRSRSVRSSRFFTDSRCVRDQRRHVSPPARPRGNRRRPRHGMASRESGAGEADNSRSTCTSATAPRGSSRARAAPKSVKPTTSSCGRTASSSRHTQQTRRPRCWPSVSQPPRRRQLDERQGARRYRPARASCVHRARYPRSDGLRRTAQPTGQHDADNAVGRWTMPTTRPATTSTAAPVRIPVARPQPRLQADALLTVDERAGSMSSLPAARSGFAKVAATKPEGPSFVRDALQRGRAPANAPSPSSSRMSGSRPTPRAPDKPPDTSRTVFRAKARVCGALLPCGAPPRAVTGFR